MSLHLTPREGRVEALREEGRLVTRAPSRCAAALHISALPTIASLRASPSEPRLQRSPCRFAGSPPAGPARSPARSACYQVCQHRGEGRRVQPGLAAARAERAGSRWSARPACRCALGAGERSVCQAERDQGRGVGLLRVNLERS